MLVREVLGHPHGMTFGNIKFHLPSGLPLDKAVQVILQNLAINGGFNIPINTQSSAKRRTDYVILSGRSLMKMRKRTGRNTEPERTPDKSRAGSET